MSWSRFIYKTHKWLAVAAGVFTFLWFASGVVMVLPTNLFGRVPAAASEPERPAFRDVTVGVPQAIAKVEATTGRRVEVTDVGFRRLLGELFYQISTDAGTHLVNARTGERLEIGEEAAWQILSRAIGSPAERLAGRLTLLREYDEGYAYGPLPVYRYPAGDAAGTIFYVAVPTGEWRATNRAGRIRGFIAGLHTFEPLRALLPARGVRLAVIGMGAVGTLMTLFGLGILYVQFLQWKRLRSQSA